MSNGATYPLGSVPALGCSTSDGGSGVATLATLSVTGGNADGTGTFTATCSGATDNAGNSNSASITYSIAYNWTGFFQPVDNLPTINTVNAGSGIPVKFSLGGDFGLNIFASGYPKVQSCSSSSGGGSSDEIEETVTAGSSTLQYDATTQTYRGFDKNPRQDITDTQMPIEECGNMLILAGASYMGTSMAYTGIPLALASWVNSLQLSPYALIAALTVMYIVLGTALDGISMIVLTTAIVIPMVKQAGFDLVWFGIFLVLVVEMAEVSPPVGFNLFVLQTMSGKDSNTVAKASLPFFFLLVLAVAIITVFPWIVMVLPQMAFPG